MSLDTGAHAGSSLTIGTQLGAYASMAVNFEIVDLETSTGAASRGGVRFGRNEHRSAAKR